MTKQKLMLNFTSGVGLRFITNAIGFVIVSFTTRALGPTDYGAYSIIFAYLFLFSTAADMGLQSLLSRDAAQTPEREAEITSSYFSLRALLAIGILLIGCILVWFIPQYSEAVRVGIMLGALYAFLQSLVQILTALFQNHLAVYQIAYADIIARAVQFIGVIGLIVIGRATLLTLVSVVVVSESVHFIAVLFWAKRLAKFHLVFLPRAWRGVLKRAAPIAISLVFVILYFKIDTVMLSIMRTPREVGLYALAYKILEILIFIPSLFAGLVMPILARSILESAEKTRAVIRLSFDVLAALALPCMVILVLLARPIIDLVGGVGFGGAVVLLRVLSAAIVLIFFGNLGGSAIIALNLQRRAMWIYGGGAVFNFVTNLMFIPRYGALAAAWTTVATEVAVTVGMFVLVNRAIGRALSFHRIMPIIAASSALAAIIFPFRHSLAISLPLALLYFPILIALGGFSWREIKSFL